MNITISVPAGIHLGYTNIWVILPAEAWTFADLLNDIATAAIDNDDNPLDAAEWKLIYDGGDVTGTDLVHNICSDGDVVEVEAI